MVAQRCVVSERTAGSGYRYNQFGGCDRSIWRLNGAPRVASLAVTVTPEPTTMALMGAGIALTGLLIRRRKA